MLKGNASDPAARICASDAFTVKGAPADRDWPCEATPSISNEKRLWPLLAF